MNFSEGRDPERCVAGRRGAALPGMNGFLKARAGSQHRPQRRAQRCTWSTDTAQTQVLADFAGGSVLCAFRERAYR